MPTPRVAPVLVLALVAGCPDRPISSVDPEPHSVERKDVPVTQNTKLDLLFVVDNSGSMQEEQDSLKLNFPQFIQQFANLPSGLPDIHIGVISTDVGSGPSSGGTVFGGCTLLGDDGALLTNRCPGIEGNFLADVAGPSGRVRNYQGALEDQFKCMAALGTKGCGAEQPLESLRRALDPQNAHNQGFLRPDSVLAVILITDEDDCSTRDRSMFSRTDTNDSIIFGCTEFGITCDEADLRATGAKHNCKPRVASPYLADVDSYVQFLHTLRPKGENFVLGAIMGETSCVQIGHPGTGPGHDDPSAPMLLATHECAPLVKGSATPPIRLDAFRAEFPNQAFAPIGEGDLTGPLATVAGMIVDNLPTWCMKGELADTNLATPALDPDCVVSDVLHPGTKTEKEVPIAACGPSGKLPCWRFETDPECAKFPTGLKLTIDRGGAAVDPDTHVRAQCVVD
ncbi:MAG: hypothetical protein K8W52_29585 [Deltaproteobacteria bacterium]|nr:hypothetical protein [Deltaproteobacteria bacterium]